MGQRMAREDREAEGGQLPLLIVAVFGLPGSGKSYFASRLAERLGAAYLSSDELRRELPRRDYSESGKSAVYRLLVGRARSALSDGKSVVLDATFHRAENRSLIDALVGKTSAAVKWIQVGADEAVIRHRLSQERRDSDADMSVHKLIKERFEHPRREHLSLKSTDDNLEDLMRRALDYLER